MKLSQVFRALGDDTRLRMLGLLSKKQLCVCQISETLGISQPNASKHLRRLCNAGIIECEKKSQWCFFSFSSSFKKECALLHSFLLLMISKNSSFREDLEELEKVMESKTCCNELLEKQKTPE